MAAVTPVSPAASTQPASVDGSNPRRTAQIANAVLAGKLNATLQVTLAASTTTSTFTDSRIGINTFVGLTPLSASAATALAAGVWVEVGAGTCTIHHASNAAADQLFAVVLLG